MSCPRVIKVCGIGLVGPAGKSILSGNGAPTVAVGTDGEFYIDLTASRLYGPKMSGAWGAGTLLKGDKGDKGDQGDPATYSNATPQPLGATASAGDDQAASRADHVHARPTAAEVGADASGTAAAAVAAHEAAANPHPGYLTASEGNAAYATAAQGALAATAIQPGNSALSDSREWSADTISQAEAEAGTATTRRAFTALRVFQAIASWWNGSAAKTKLDGIADGATANSSDATLLNRANHTGTQSAGTITGLGGAATLNVGTTSGTVAAGDDSRLSNSRTPTDGSVTDQKIDANGLSASTINWVAITPWAASTSYAKGALVEYLGIAYRRSAAGTSGATFNTANWQQVTPTTFAADQLPIVTTTARGAVPAYGFDAITYGATVDLSMSALDGTFKTISLTGNLTFTTSNRANGRTVTIRLVCDSTQRTLTFHPDWKFVGSKPANIAASKVAVLSLTFFGTADADCIAAYGVQS